MGNSFDIRKDLGDYLMMIRDDDMQRSITEYVTTELKHDVDCSYTVLALKNVTFYNTLTETIPKEKVVSYIQEFVANFFQVINSSELESNYGTLRDNLRNIIRNTDFDRVFSKMFLAFLLSRSLVLDVDIMEVFQNLDSLHRTIGEGWWSPRSLAGDGSVHFNLRHKDNSVGQILGKIGRTVSRAGGQLQDSVCGETTVAGDQHQDSDYSLL